MLDTKKNIKVGEGALKNNGSHLKEGLEHDKYPQNNIAMGDNSLHKNISGYQNTAFGGLSLSENEKSSNNTAFGFKALKNSMGEYNTAFGAKAGTTLRTGISNTLIGKEADTSEANSVNETVIGANAVGGGKNTVTLGNSKVTEVNMSQSKNAKVNCGGLNMHDIEGNKSYSLPKSDGKEGQVLKTNGNGELVWEKDNSGSGGASVSNNPPTVSDTSGNAGDLRFDNDYLYICMGSGVWKKASLSSVSF